MQIKLDFNISGYENRSQFLKEYIQQNESRLTKDNLEMMANYLLWAIQDENGEDFQIDNKGPWKAQSQELSWEGLQERAEETGMPVESVIAEVPVAKKKAKLDRSSVLAKLNVKRTAVKIARVMSKEDRKDCFAILAGLLDNVQEDDNSANVTQDSNAENILQDLTAALDYSTHLTCGRVIDWTGWKNIIFGEERHPLADSWFALWKSIDETEFIVQTYELRHGKRRPDLPIREELFERLAFSVVFEGAAISLQEKVSILELEADTLDAISYLKKKRSLVDLRTQQYTLLDLIKDEPIQLHINPGHYYGGEIEGIQEIYPFQDMRLFVREVSDKCFTRDFQDICIKALRRCDTFDDNSTAAPGTYIDLRNMDVIRALLMIMPRLKGESYGATIDKREVYYKLKSIMDYYIAQCDFSPELLFILKNKINGISNKQIADSLKEQFNISYQENYISTIFTKRILASLKEQVDLHYKMIEYFTIGKTIFKRCSVCGKLLPRNSVYFNKRTSTSDGFFSYCKKCKHEKDMEKKVKGNAKSEG